MNRSDLLVAIAATAVGGEAHAATDPTPAMGSSVFEWNSIPVKTNDHGTSRQFFDSRTVSLEHFELHVTTLAPGKMPHPAHRHPNEEMMIVQKGTLEAFQNGEWKRVGTGSVIFNASNELHGLRNPGTEQAVYHVINWKTAATPAA